MEGDGVSVSRAGEMISRAPSSTPPLESFLRCPPNPEVAAWPLPTHLHQQGAHDLLGEPLRLRESCPSWALTSHPPPQCLSPWPWTCSHRPRASLVTLAQKSKLCKPNMSILWYNLGFKFVCFIIAVIYWTLMWQTV